MCIRDRYTIPAVTHPKECWGKLEESSEPVSYTHLDVYKRQEVRNPRYQMPINEVEYPTTNDSLWEEKILEIRRFKSTTSDHSPSPDQIEMLVGIYNRHRHVLSDVPGKVRSYQRELRFKESVNFNRKSYPIAYSLKEAVRAEINQLLKDDIIECSQSPYTLSLIHI